MGIGDQGGEGGLIPFPGNLFVRKKSKTLIKNFIIGTGVPKTDEGCC